MLKKGINIWQVVLKEYWKYLQSGQTFKSSESVTAYMSDVVEV